MNWSEYKTDWMKMTGGIDIEKSEDSSGIGSLIEQVILSR